MKEQIVSFLDKHLPEAHYSDGKEAKCIVYRLFNAFDMTDD